MNPLTILSALSASVLLIAWVLYPLSLRLLASARHLRHPSHGPGSLAALIVTRDAPATVQRRIANLRESRGISFDDVAVVLDWTVRHQQHEFEAALGVSARVVIGDPPGGKAAGLNAGLRALVTEWVLLADSSQSYAPDAVRKLLDAVADGTYAAVSGRVVHEHEDAVMAAYWRYEGGIRRAQGARHSIITTSGAITLVRRDAVAPIPVGAICDDLFMTLGLAMGGKRVGYVPDAVAYDPRRLTRRQLFQKKVRTLTGLWQLLVWKPAVLSPRRNPVWADFACHKVARLATPYLVLLTAASAAVPLLRLLGSLPLSVRLAMAGAAVLPLLVRPRAWRASVSAAAWMAMLLAAPVIAACNAVRRDWGVWHEHRTADPAASPALVEAE